MKIAVLVGSLRKGSYSRQLAEKLIALQPPELSCAFVEIGDLPLYNQDYDDEHRAPPAYGRFREAIRAAEGVLFVTPEYNRSVPAVLKNALDVGSRPYGQSVWDRLPAAVVSQSPGGLGGFGANHHLRQSFVFLNMPVLQQPEAYVSHSAKLLEGGVDSRTTEFLRSIMTSFARFAATNRKGAA